MAEPTGDAATVFPPPAGLPDATEPRDTLTPEQTALARYTAELVLAALAPRIDALDNGIASCFTRLEAIDNGQLGIRRELAAIHEQGGRQVVRTEGLQAAVRHLVDQMIKQQFINDQARGEIADHLAMQPKAGNETRGGE